MSDGFGKISFKLACRLGELTANEMRVLIYLYACRNEDTLQCNPRRRKIVADIRIGKANLSRALKSLEENGWILEDESGNFQLFEAHQIPQKVVDSTTKVVRSTTISVVDSTTKVVRSTTESCQINNTHIKDLNREKNRERTEKDGFAAPAAQNSFSSAENQPTADKPNPAEIEESPKAIIWRQGVKLLISQGEAEQKARAFLGKLCGTYGETLLAMAISAAILQNAFDAKSYLVGILQKEKSAAPEKNSPEWWRQKREAEEEEQLRVARLKAREIMAEMHKKPDYSHLPKVTYAN